MELSDDGSLAIAWDNPGQRSIMSFYPTYQLEVYDDITEQWIQTPGTKASDMPHHYDALCKILDRLITIQREITEIVGPNQRRIAYRISTDRGAVYNEWHNTETTEGVGKWDAIIPMLKTLVARYYRAHDGIWFCNACHGHASFQAEFHTPELCSIAYAQAIIAKWDSITLTEGGAT